MQANFFHRRSKTGRARIARMTGCLLTGLLAFEPADTHAANIGTWVNYMAYREIQDIQPAGNYLFVRASNNLYKYNKLTGEITPYDKVNYMNDTEITHIKWNSAVKRLIVVYSDSNIDLIDTDNKVSNVSSLYDKSMTEDKTVNHVYVHDKYAYLSTGFGIVKVNMKDANINESYMLGFDVDYSYIDGDYIYAASQSKGLYRAPLTANLIDYNNWKACGNYTPLNEPPLDEEQTALVKTLQPGGPYSNKFYQLNMNDDNRLFTSGGFFASGKPDNKIPGTIQVWNGSDWQLYDQDVATKTGRIYIDVDCVVLDPTSTTTDHTFAGGRTGLYEFEDGVLKKDFTQDNSPLKQYGNNYTLVEGLTFDKTGNLWVLNSSVAGVSLFEYTKSGEWISHHNEAFTFNGTGFATMVNPMFDSRGLLWFCNANYTCPALACYRKASGSQDEYIKVYKKFVNEDGQELVVTEVRDVEEDKNGNIWVATNVGPLYLTPSDITDGSEIFTQYKVPRNDGTNLADYLLANVSTSCITIDGANRKWFGTDNDGVYLISEDNNTQIAHFTTSNSALLSNTVYSIAINSKTGEVFFATEKGLCSYKSDATEPVEEMTKDDVYAYPNPVEPDYTGLITVTGLSFNADVKITTATGKLVAEGRSNGGTFTWNGYDLEGRRVVSGVYNVLTAKSDGSKGTVCKIAIVR